MKHWNGGILFLAVGMAACSVQSPVTPTPTEQFVIETPLFPPTWTPTSPAGTKAVPQETGTIAASSPTITPTGTAVPPTINNEPLPATATPDFSRSSCTMSTNQLGIELYPAPYFQDHHILPTMEPGFAYTAAETFPTMVRLIRDGRTAGWVDYRMLAVSLDGSGCLETQYSGELTDFMDVLCFMVADPPVETYFDAEYTQTTGMMVGPEPRYVVTSIGSEGPRGACVGHAGPCFRVAPGAVDTVGDCGSLPRSAETTAAVELWSQPDGNAGEPIRELEVGQSLFVQSGEDTNGPAPPGGPSPGRWLHVKLSGSRLPRHGWVWSEYVIYR